MATMNVSLTDKLAAFVESEVATGQYASQSEVVRDALRLLAREKAAEEEKLAILRREIELGFQDYKEGRLSDQDARDIAEEIHKDIFGP